MYKNFEFLVHFFFTPKWTNMKRVIDLLQNKTQRFSNNCCIHSCVGSKIQVLSVDPTYYAFYLKKEYTVNNRGNSQML